MWLPLLVKDNCALRPSLFTTELVAWVHHLLSMGWFVFSFVIFCCNWGISAWLLGVGARREGNCVLVTGLNLVNISGCCSLSRLGVALSSIAELMGACAKIGTIGDTYSKANVQIAVSCPRNEWRDVGRGALDLSNDVRKLTDAWHVIPGRCHAWKERGSNFFKWNSQHDRMIMWRVQVYLTGRHWWQGTLVCRGGSC